MTSDPWYKVQHPFLRGVVTYWRDPSCANEHHDRLKIKYGKCDAVQQVEEVPSVYMG